MMTSLLTDDLGSTRNLFVDLLAFEIEYEADWIISMRGQEGGRVAAMARTSEFIPEAFRHGARGVVVTFVVDDVDRYFQMAERTGLDVVEPPTDLPYGQRRLLLHDASGALVDISSPVAPLDPAYS